MLHIASSFLIRYFVNNYTFDTIVKRIEISTPQNSWTSLQECVALLNHGVEPFESTSCHALPLVVKLFSHVLNFNSEYLVLVIFWLCDVHCAYFLAKAAENFLKRQIRSEQAEKSTYANDALKLLVTEHDVNDIKRLVRLCYLYNPFTILSCAARTTTTITNLFIALTFYCMSARWIHLSSLFLAFATYLDVYPCTFIVGVLLCVWNKKNFNWKFWKNSAPAIVTFVLCLGCLLVLSAYLFASWRFLSNTYGFILSVPDLTPNVGLFWYFFTETFDHFRLFFLCVFLLNPLIYVAPLTIKLKNEPAFLFYLLLIIVTIFKPYPSIGDSALYLSLLPMWSHLFRYARHGLVVSCAFAACIILAPVMWHLWIETGSANANFFFAITLVYSTAQIFLLTDLFYAHLRRKLHLMHGLDPMGDEGRVVLD